MCDQDVQFFSGICAINKFYYSPVNVLHQRFPSRSSGEMTPYIEVVKMKRRFKLCAFSLASLIVSMVAVLVVGWRLFCQPGKQVPACQRADRIARSVIGIINRSGKTLLRRLCEANEPERRAEPATAASEPKRDEDIIRLRVAER